MLDAGPCVEVLVPGSYGAVVLGDFEQDGRVDIALAAGDAVVLLPDGRRDRMSRLPVDRPLALAAVDLDGDGWLELIAAHPAGLTVWSRGLGPARAYAVPGGGISLAVADFDGDGRRDLAVVSQPTSSVSVLSGMSDGGLGAPVSYPTGLSSTAVAAADFDVDGRPDLAVVGFDAFDVEVLLSRDGGLVSSLSHATDPWPLAIAAGDFDRDGTADLVVTGSATPELLVVTHPASPTFTRTQVPIQAAARPVLAADFDGDGRLDLAIAHWAMPGAVGLLDGLPDGGFGGERTFALGVRPAALAVGDLDSDGALDLIAADDSDGGALFLRGTCLKR
jgi:hypothetical protein